MDEHTPMDSLDILLERVRACRICADELPLGPRPVLRASATARILIVGQAPGTRVHETGIPWNDPSGDRLRAWMGVDRERFYDESRIAIIPAGFCYPGRNARGGDLPPRPECAATWHRPLRAQLKAVEFLLLAGQYAQQIYLPDGRKRSLTERVRAWRDYWPAMLPVPHPSFRNNRWLKQHPWFETEVVPVLQNRVWELLR